jgi:outer membrane protein
MKPSRFRSRLLISVLLCGLSAAASASAQNNQEIAETKPKETPVTIRTNVQSANEFVRSRDNAALSLARVGVQSAQPISITLNDAIRRALANNNDIEISRDDVRFQETQVRAARGIFDPVLSLSPLYTRNSTTGQDATNDFHVNSSVSQFIENTGGNYQVFFNNQRTENGFNQAQVTSGAVANTGNAIYSSSLGASFVQPLARNFRFDSKRHAISIARKRLEQTDTDFRLRATDTITATERAYWDFVFTLRNQQNQVANVDLAKENLRQIEARISAGAAAPLEKAEVETELANREGDLLVATQQVSIAENTLKQLVLGDPLSTEWSQTFVPTDAPAFGLVPADLDAAMKDALDNRFELKRLRLQHEINAEDIRLFKNQIKPQIDANSTFSLEGLSSSATNSDITTNLLTSPQDLYIFSALNTTRTALGLATLPPPSILIPAGPSYLFGGFNRSLANMFRSDAPNWSAGVTISFPFRNRTAKANLDSAKIQEHQIDTETRSQEQTVIVEVRNAVQAVETARQRVLTARRAQENAEIQLAGEQKLYEAGKSTTFLLFQRENTLNNAKNAEIRAETDYNKAVADLQRVTSTAFRENNITVDSPVAGLH